MADSLIARLSTVPGLIVLSASSVLRYGGSEQDPLSAAQDLGVGWIVDGWMFRSDDRLRVSARLLRASDGRAAWSDSFDERYTDIFEVQDGISQRVAHALTSTLQPGAVGDGALEEMGGTHNPEAYQLYLTAKWRAQGNQDDDIARALALLNQALILDPKYSLAWVEVAQVHRRRLWRSDGLPSEVFEPAKGALRRALTLISEFPAARAGNGFSLFWYDFDWRGAEREFRAAIQGNPNMSTGHWGLAQLLLNQAKYDEGFEHIRRTLELESVSPSYYAVGGGLMAERGMYEDAERHLALALDTGPTLWMAHSALGLMRIAQGRRDEGVASLRKGASMGDSTRPKAILAVCLARMGQQEEGRAILDQLRLRARERYVSPVSIASIECALGNHAHALDALDRAYEMREARMAYLQSDDHFKPLKSEPRFKALLVKLRLDDYPVGISPI